MAVYNESRLNYLWLAWFGLSIPIILCTFLPLSTPKPRTPKTTGSGTICSSISSIYQAPNCHVTNHPQ